jgi:hypothetical protein
MARITDRCSSGGHEVVTAGPRDYVNPRQALLSLVSQGTQREGYSGAAGAYMEVWITGHNAFYDLAQSVVVTSSSGGCFQGDKVSKVDAYKPIDELGTAGWGLGSAVSLRGGAGGTQTLQHWFKRPLDAPG